MNPLEHERRVLACGTTVLVRPLAAEIILQALRPVVHEYFDADRESMFEAGETASGSGSGLGLAIVRRIAQAHGWTVTLSESEAGGARFEFRT